MKTPPRRVRDARGAQSGPERGSAASGPGGIRFSVPPALDHHHQRRQQEQGEQGRKGQAAQHADDERHEDDQLVASIVEHGREPEDGGEAGQEHRPEPVRAAAAAAAMAGIIAFSRRIVL